MNTPFNVLHTVASLKFKSGGTSVFVSSLCDSLAEKGMGVSVATAGDRKYEKQMVFPQNKEIPVILFKGIVFGGRDRLSWVPFLSSRIESICTSKQTKIIHDHGLWLQSNHSASLVSIRQGIPLVLHPHGMLEKWSLQHKQYKKYMAWWLYQKKILDRVSLFVATSVSEMESLRRLGFRQPVAFLPNSVSIPKLLPKEKKHNSARVLLFLSRIHPKKGLLNLVRAWRSVAPRNWKVIIAGYDELNHSAEVEREIRGLGMSDQFTFVGPVEGQTKEDLFRQADLFVLPTFSENFGLVVAEALSYGIPVITTTGTPWKQINHLGCGWCVNPDSESIAEAISQATSLTDIQRREMGLKGRVHVIENYSSSKLGAQMVEVYRWILRKGPKPKCVVED